ncbi:MAG: hypothetical protein COU32_00785 [Candidatus Magasanikbacteria bacterium CG10_big_fil_rev_8_21_14_0_10_42_10]|uniref:Uncharacterized protein n=2 Tax=Candidatus Magasanikiibacteriota TaxID=1752731 RepID=A0A2H0TWZ3_9BACT|nr:MAG: hypothetical protein COU32_00785 [Candidatus Magasanikbacteria bacterium CG10_big_fil_rev_8_21_14_0_10_42_10]PIZ94643.1 MAG: hypothetical protein COX82_00295 [Candidatus Magasanikbacteria bacterium CG_4_10_14_0_2_um_filter_41_10]
MKRIFLFLFLFFLLVPQVSFAAIDSRCWIEKQCIDQRLNEDSSHYMTPKEIQEGFVQNSTTIAACGKEDANHAQLGFCLPSTNAKTKITFGSQNVFNNIGEFITLMYKYGIIAAGVLATLMLIAAGFMWTTSGGNSERIGSAKKRIAGAIMGLLLAVLSYALLNTINPALVTIRLPQVWSINTQGIAPPYCDAITPPKNLAPLGPPTLTQAERESLSKTLPAANNYTTTSTEAMCGTPYFVEGAGDMLCTGRTCVKNPNGNLCYQYIAGPNKEKLTNWHCVRSNLILSFRMTGTWTTVLSTIDGFKAFLETIENKWIDMESDDPEIWHVCQGQDGFLYRGDEQNISWNQVQKIQTKGESTLLNQEVFDYDFVFPPLDLTDSKWCTHSPYDKLKGLFVMVELKESGDLTDPDLWIGQASPKENNTSESIIGAWLKTNENGTRITYDDYIPIENLAKGVYMTVNVSTDVFQTIETYTGSDNGMPSNETADPGSNVSKKYTVGKVKDGTSK